MRLTRLTIIGGMTGVYVELPAEKVGSQRVELHRVTVRDTALHGVHINDATYSIASIRLFISSSKFLDNGFGDHDQDGVLVEETSKGMLFASILDSLFRGNASDGLSLDENGGGSVSVTIANSHFLSNGANPVFPIDPDDGLDVDERGPGDVWLMVSESRFNKNFDDGLDIDERQGGTIYSNLENVKATKNLDQGITYEEGQNGDLFATINDSTITNNDETQDIDVRGVQSDSGTGTLTLDNVTYGKSSLTGLQLILVP